MHILLTNDDGVMAPGLAALSKAFRTRHKVTILAPDRNWSASGHAKTMYRPLRVKNTTLLDGTPAMMTDGAPSDCVSLALLGLVKEPIDAVISGINPLANLGHDVTYSGTVAAAMEAALSGLKGFAISLNGSKDLAGKLDYRFAAQVALELVEKMQTYSTPQHVLFNINVPYCSTDEMKGFKITRQGETIYHDVLQEREDPNGQPYYWLGGDLPTGVLDPGTDFHALAEGYVSITPLQLDLTAYSFLETVESWPLDFDFK